jgi:hypothetical protein
VQAGGPVRVPRSEITVVVAAGKEAGRCSSVGAVAPFERQTRIPYRPEPTRAETLGRLLGTQDLARCGHQGGGRLRIRRRGVPAITYYNP